MDNLETPTFVVLGVMHAFGLIIIYWKTVKDCVCMCVWERENETWWWCGVRRQQMSPKLSINWVKRRACALHFCQMLYVCVCVYGRGEKFIEICSFSSKFFDHVSFSAMTWWHFDAYIYSVRGPMLFLASIYASSYVFKGQNDEFYALEKCSGRGPTTVFSRVIPLR